MYKKFRCKMPVNLQIFADPGQAGQGGAGAGAGQGGAGAGTGQAGQEPGAGQGGAAPGIDYDKIQRMLDGTLAAKEDTALKAYFKQQGLSQEEMAQAIGAFKQQRAANTPDASALQAQLAAAQKQCRESIIENAAILQAVSLGIGAKTIPYVIKMANLGDAVGQDGKINEESVKNALDKVLEDVPGMKPQAAQGGPIQVGAPGPGGQAKTDDDALKKAFGL